MASAQITVTSRTGGKVFPTTDAWVEDLKDQLRLILPKVAGQEYDRQVAGGNPPSNILVDGRASSPAGIATATRRVQLFFLDVEDVLRAVQAAHAELQRLYFRKTGASAATIQVWGTAGRRHSRLSGIGDVRAFLTANRNAGTYIRLIGPMVPWRRALYYSPRGGSLRFRSIKNLSALRLAELERAGARARVVRLPKKTRVEVESSETVSAIIKQSIVGKFGRGVYFSARWIQVPVPGWKGATKRRQGVPAVAIGWRLKGAQ